MNPEKLIQEAINPALEMLPPHMTSTPAIRMMVAIAHQESNLQHRKQIGGPARGYWQFERRGGVKGVMSHRLTQQHAIDLCHALDVDPETHAVHDAITYNDILAAGFARLLLWTVPKPLPGLWDRKEGWEQYIQSWRPGKPHLYRWQIAWGIGQTHSAR